MKAAMRRSLGREITSTLSRYLSILAIVALGVGFFAGLKATSPVMRHNGDRYFDAQNMMDIRLLSTLGFTGEDLEAVAKEPFVENAQGGASLDVLTESESGLKTARIYTVPAAGDDKAINRPLIVEGRMPLVSGECVIDKNQTRGGNRLLDTKIILSENNTDETWDRLKVHEFTVTGIVESPLYISMERGTSSIGNGSVAFFMMVPKEDVDLDVHTEILLTLKDARELQGYSDAYDALVDDAKEQLETLSEERETLRYGTILQEAQEKLDEASRSLEEARNKAGQELGEARDKLEKAEADILSGQEKLEKTRKDLEKAAASLEKKEAEFRQQTEAGQAQLEAAAAQISGMRKEYEAKKTMTEAAKPQMTEEQWQAAQAGLEEARLRLETGEKELSAKQAAFQAGKASALAEFKTARNKIAKGWQEVQTGERDLAEARQALENGRKDYEEQKTKAEEELREAEDKIEEGRLKMADIKRPQWYVLGRDSNPGFVGFGADADRIDAISKVFPAFFFLVAALVCLTTMTRMVEEQRTQIGTLKALGYGKGAIAAKYLLYAGSASLLGSGAGLALGYLTFPSVIYKAYGILYSLPPVILEFNIPYAVISSALAVTCTLLATLWACYHELASAPAELIRPKAPKPGRRVLLERIPFIWKRFSFLIKVTIRNLFRYKKRFFMTILGVGGCTTLLLTGFGLRDSIMGIVTKQFGEIHTYDMTLGLSEPVTADGNGVFAGEIEAIQGQSLPVMRSSVDASFGNTTIQANLYVPQDAEALNHFIRFRQRISQQPIPFPQPGKAILSEKLATRLKVHVGDSLSIDRGDLQKADIVVGGITENYVYNFIYMTAEDYEKGFGLEPEFTQVLVDIPKAETMTEDDEKALSARLLAYEEVTSVTVTGKSRRDFGKTMKSLDAVVVLIIICANLLAFVVLYNLTNVNITERIREIATIKVLGFYDKEVSTYVYRENLVLTLFGGLLGLVGGYFLHQFVVRTAEVDMVMFERIIRPESYIWSLLLTFAFTLFVNLVMFFRLRSISMVESLKSAE